MLPKGFLKKNGWCTRRDWCQSLHFIERETKNRSRRKLTAAPCFFLISWEQPLLPLVPLLPVLPGPVPAATPVALVLAECLAHHPNPSFDPLQYLYLLEVKMHHPFPSPLLHSLCFPCCNLHTLHLCDHVWHYWLKRVLHVGLINT